ncbi:actin binding protein [Balamuthia mandrillaris]
MTDRRPSFGEAVDQRPVTIAKSASYEGLGEGHNRASAQLEVPGKDHKKREKKEKKKKETTSKKAKALSKFNTMSMKELEDENKKLRQDNNQLQFEWQRAQEEIKELKAKLDKILEILTGQTTTTSAPATAVATITPKQANKRRFTLRSPRKKALTELPQPLPAITSMEQARDSTVLSPSLTASQPSSVQPEAQPHYQLTEKEILPTETPLPILALEDTEKNTGESHDEDRLEVDTSGSSSPTSPATTGGGTTPRGEAAANLELSATTTEEDEETDETEPSPRSTEEQNICSSSSSSSSSFSVTEQNVSNKSLEHPSRGYTTPTPGVKQPPHPSAISSPLAASSLEGTSKEGSPFPGIRLHVQEGFNSKRDDFKKGSSLARFPLHKLKRSKTLSAPEAEPTTGEDHSHHRHHNHQRKKSSGGGHEVEEKDTLKKSSSKISRSFGTLKKKLPKTDHSRQRALRERGGERGTLERRRSVVIVRKEVQEGIQQTTANKHIKVSRQEEMILVKKIMAEIELAKKRRVGIQKLVAYYRAKLERQPQEAGGRAEGEGDHEGDKERPDGEDEEDIQEAIAKNEAYLYEIDLAVALLVNKKDEILSKHAAQDGDVKGGEGEMSPPTPPALPLNPSTKTVYALREQPDEISSANSSAPRLEATPSLDEHPSSETVCSSESEELAGQGRGRASGGVGDEEKVIMGNALFDFEAANENELSLREGDQVKILMRITPEWCFAEANGMTGMVPINYVGFRRAQQGEYVVAVFDFEGQSEHELSFYKGQFILLTECEEGSDWWRGRTDEGREGLFPCTFVQVLTTEGEQQRQAQQQQQQQQQITTSFLGELTYKVKGLYDFVPQVEGELSFHAGEIITLLDYREGEEWWKGRVGNRVGLFPANYVEVLL